MLLPGPPALAALLAHPVSYSLSPAMHNSAFRAAGLVGYYQACDILPSDLSQALLELRESELLGVNLSIPHKEVAVHLVDFLSPEAKAIGAINTIVRQGKKLHGLNTDAAGFMRALAEDDCHPKTAVVLGAGGAARAIVWALRHEGVKVTVWNRTFERAQHLAQAFGADWIENQNEIPAVDLIVNATSVGLNDPTVSPIPKELLTRTKAVCDLVYKPLYTKMIKDAGSLGLHTVDGLGMLLHQAALAFQAWTGVDALDSMREALERAAYA